MSVKNEAMYQGSERGKVSPALNDQAPCHAFEKQRIDAGFKKPCANKREPAIEDTFPKVEYRPKGYLRVVKKTYEEGRRLR